jgi:hypothetical protein
VTLLGFGSVAEGSELIAEIFALESDELDIPEEGIAHVTLA